ncbi:MAG: cyclic nucleotide-binding domain-containing protein [Candidatus Eremiobacteraeota bacterium]|nr:cyclic nucleotide-binding domain-containing protein [Candidatus Eremiobacteraeota bacterium]
MIDPLEKIKAIKRSSVFTNLLIEDISRFSDIIQEVEYPAGHVVFREGDPGDKMYLIVSGEVTIRKDITDGVDMQVTIGDGECFGEMAILDGMPRSATVTVMKPGVFLSIGRDEFIDLLTVYPEISLQVISILSGRLREAHTNIAKTIREQL